MNLLKAYEQGQKSANKGLSFGIDDLDGLLGGIHKGRMYLVGAAPKVGKSTFVDYSFVISTLLNDPKVIVWYYSFEITVIDKQFDFAAHFINKDYGVDFINLPEGVFRDGQSTVELSSDYLSGRLIDDNKNLISVSPEIEKMFIAVYHKYLIPFFGEYDSEGNLVKRGRIRFQNSGENPTGIFKQVSAYMEKRGTTKKNDTGTRVISYTPHDAEETLILVIDHIRKVIPEQGMQLKQTMDLCSNYSIRLRDNYNIVVVNIVHLNRNVSEITRLRALGEYLFPSEDEIKDSGNLAEDSDVIMTMMNPNDDRYNLKRHFGLEIRDSTNAPLYPDLITLHITSARRVKCPQHIRLNLHGAIKKITKFNI